MNVSCLKKEVLQIGLVDPPLWSLKNKEVFRIVPMLSLLKEGVLDWTCGLSLRSVPDLPRVEP